jgi:hypothetical protein
VGASAASADIKGRFPSEITLFTPCTLSEMEVVINYEVLLGAHGEEVIKEVSVSAEDVHETFRFLPPYTMNDHSSEDNGLSWNDGIIPYSSIFQTLAEATSNIAHLYAKGDDKCAYLSSLLGRSVQNLDPFGCPKRKDFRMTTGCSLPCHRFPDNVVRHATHVIFTNG